MLFMDIIALYYKNHTKPLDIRYGQNTELSVKTGGIYTYQ
jgi:hypothetical protein